MAGKLASFAMVVSTLVLTGAARADCANPVGDAEIVTCLGQELRQSDRQINDSYQRLMTTLDESGKTQLRNEQRAWLRQRDAACVLDNKESNRERWLQAILQDGTKTVCVIRFTGQRAAQLDAKLGAAATRNAPAATPPSQGTRPLPVPTAPAVQAMPSAPAAPAPHRPPTSISNTGLLSFEGYDFYSRSRHDRGRWYFEVLVKPGEIAAMVETTLSIGAVSSASTVGRFVRIRKADVNRPPVNVGVAIDLENGKIYLRTNGDWSIPVGNAAGHDLKLNRSYVAGIGSSTSLSPLLDHGLVQINFGERLFAYSMPDGYRPYAQP